jgi:hypothetical protein
MLSTQMPMAEARMRGRRALAALGGAALAASIVVALSSDSGAGGHRLLAPHPARLPAQRRLTALQL